MAAGPLLRRARRGAGPPVSGPHDDLVAALTLALLDDPSVLLDHEERLLRSLPMGSQARLAGAVAALAAGIEVGDDRADELDELHRSLAGRLPTAVPSPQARSKRDGSVLEGLARRAGQAGDDRAAVRYRRAAALSQVSVDPGSAVTSLVEVVGALEAEQPCDGDAVFDTRLALAAACLGVEGVRAADLALGLLADARRQDRDEQIVRAATAAALACVAIGLEPAARAAVAEGGRSLRRLRSTATTSARRTVLGVRSALLSDMALLLALRAGDRGQAAELIERSRSLWTGRPSGESRAGERADAGAVTGRSADAALPEVTVAGIRRVASACAGEDAWWWGMRWSDARLWWVLVPPAGEVVVGVTNAAGLARAWRRWLQRLPYRERDERRATFEDRWRHSPLWLPMGREAAESAGVDDLAAWLLPDPLRDELLARSGDDPLPLVVAAPRALAAAPWPLLEVRRGGPRLVERALVVMAPPANLAEPLLDRRGYRAPAPPCAPAAEVVDVRTIGTDAAAVTWDDLRPRLASTSAGLFHFFGHSTGSGRPVPGTEGFEPWWRDPSDHGLELGLAIGDERVSAADLGRLTSDASVPAGVVLTGCATTGWPVDGSEEWSGLPAALAWAGARWVLGTSWPLPVCAATEAFDAALVGRVHEAGPAQALRAMQLEVLDAGSLASAGNEPVPPMVWGGWTATGFAG